ncbi:MAG: hypothetical protein F6J95_031435 [Leptolyngbya sp. SIO1E4]|nr:hypothetical protein [Leptolyngbya sp. SIO1E4]
MTTAQWLTKRLQTQRLHLTQALVGQQPMILVIDETGDREKGQATDYVAKQYIGNIGASFSDVREPSD